MRRFLPWVVVPFLMVGCGGGSSDEENNDNALPEYENVTLQSGTIYTDQTVQPDDGLTFKVTAEEAENLYVTYYDADGALDPDQITIRSNTGSVSSFDEEDMEQINYTYTNSSEGATISFSFENESNAPMTFSIAAWQPDGDKESPVALTVGESHAGHVGHLGNNSYYAFTKNGDGAVTISLLQSDSMSQAAQDMHWEITTDLSINTVIASCNGDDYSDFNVSCTKTLDAGEYYIVVSNYYGDAYSKYTIDVEE